MSWQASRRTGKQLIDQTDPQGRRPLGGEQSLGLQEKIEGFFFYFEASVFGDNPGGARRDGGMERRFFPKTF